jgi:hypothetical protein
MRTRRLVALLASLTLVGTVIAVDASAVAPTESIACVIGGESTVNVTRSVRQSVQMFWADANHENFSQEEIFPDRRARTISSPTPEGAQLLTVFIAYSNDGTTGGGNLLLEVECTTAPA